ERQRAGDAGGDPVATDHGARVAVENAGDDLRCRVHGDDAEGAPLGVLQHGDRARGERLRPPVGDKLVGIDPGKAVANRARFGLGTEADDGRGLGHGVVPHGSTPLNPPGAPAKAPGPRRARPWGTVTPARFRYHRPRARRPGPAGALQACIPLALTVRSRGTEGPEPRRMPCPRTRAFWRSRSVSAPARPRCAAPISTGSARRATRVQPARI